MRTGDRRTFMLMHKNIETARIEVEAGRIVGLRETLCPEHMPVGTYASYMTKDICCVYLQAWQKARAIPLERSNLSYVLRAAKRDVFELAALGHGMGLTDQYWFREDGESCRWEDICFAKIGFHASALTLTGGGEVVPSPDYETNGALPKAWVLLDRVPALLKDSPAWLLTASANEVIASQFAQICGVPHASYFPLKVGDKTYCASPCFVDSDSEEFVSLLAYLRTNRGSSIEKAKEMGLSQEFLDNMTAFDLLIGNTDRHEGNFGIIIDPNTMGFVRPAPLFDSGTSLHQWYGNDEYFKPFHETKAEALKKLQGIQIKVPSREQIEDIVSSVYEQFGYPEYTKHAIAELCHNADSLRQRQLELREQEADICL